MGRHCCSCCPEDASRSDLSTEFGIGVELYFQFLKWLRCTFFLLFLVSIPTLYIILKTGEYGQTLTQGIGALAIPTLGNLGEGEAICSDSEEAGTMSSAKYCFGFRNKYTHIELSDGEIGLIQEAYFGRPSGMCGCPDYMLPDAATGNCPHKKDVTTTPSTCKPGEFCLLSTEPTLGTACCASHRDENTGRADFSSIRPRGNATCGSSFAKDIVEGICFWRKTCQINIDVQKVYNWTTKISTDKLELVRTCNPELVYRTEKVPILTGERLGRRKGVLCRVFWPKANQSRFYGPHAGWMSQ